MIAQWERELPEEFKEVAYTDSTGEMAWPKEAALKVVDYLTKRGLPVLGVEVWIPRGTDPSIPGYYTGDAAADVIHPINAHNNISANFIREFSWDHPAADTALAGVTPYFNLTVDAD